MDTRKREVSVIYATIAAGILILASAFRIFEGDSSPEVCGSNRILQAPVAGVPEANKVAAAESILALWPHYSDSKGRGDSAEVRLMADLAQVLGDTAEPILVQVMLKRGPGSLPAVSAYARLGLRPQPLAMALSDTSLDYKSRLIVFSALSNLEGTTDKRAGTLGPARIGFACELLRRIKVELSNEPLLPILASVIGQFQDEKVAGSPIAASVLNDSAFSHAERTLKKRGYL